MAGRPDSERGRRQLPPDFFRDSERDNRPTFHNGYYTAETWDRSPLRSESPAAAWDRSPLRSQSPAAAWDRSPLRSQSPAAACQGPGFLPRWVAGRRCPRGGRFSVTGLSTVSPAARLSTLRPASRRLHFVTVRRLFLLHGPGGRWLPQLAPYTSSGRTVSPAFCSSPAPVFSTIEQLFLQTPQLHTSSASLFSTLHQLHTSSAPLFFISMGSHAIDRHRFNRDCREKF